LHWGFDGPKQLCQIANIGIVFARFDIDPEGNISVIYAKGINPFPLPFFLPDLVHAVWIGHCREQLDRISHILDCVKIGNHILHWHTAKLMEFMGKVLYQFVLYFRNT
jgi:hypothetical protein